MKRVVMAIGFSLAICAPEVASAHTAQAGQLQVIHPWVAPAEKGSTTLVKPTISNTGKEPIEITGAVSPAAGEIGLMRDGKPVKTITIKPGETFMPEQVQLELRDLRVTLPEGKGVPISLKTSNGKPLEFVVAIGEDTMDPQQTVSTP